jgi:hypothetical protein
MYYQHIVIQMKRFHWTDECTIGVTTIHARLSNHVGHMSFCLPENLWREEEFARLNGTSLNSAKLFANYIKHECGTFERVG